MLPLFIFLHNNISLSLSLSDFSLRVLCFWVTCGLTVTAFENDVVRLVSGESACRRGANPDAAHKPTYNHWKPPSDTHAPSTSNQFKVVVPKSTHCAQLRDWLHPLSVVLNGYTTTTNSTQRWTMAVYESRKTDVKGRGLLNCLNCPRVSN